MVVYDSVQLAAFVIVYDSVQLGILFLDDSPDTFWWIPQGILWEIPQEISQWIPRGNPWELSSGLA